MPRDDDLKCDVYCVNQELVARVNAVKIGDGLAGRLADTFKALADPTRVKIIDALSHAELCVCDLARVLEMTDSAICHQLRLLRNLGLVKSRREGRIVYYSLDDDHILHLFAEAQVHVSHQEGEKEK